MHVFVPMCNSSVQRRVVRKVCYVYLSRSSCRLDQRRPALLEVLGRVAGINEMRKQLALLQQEVKPLGHVRRVLLLQATELT